MFEVYAIKDISDSDDTVSYCGTEHSDDSSVDVVEKCPTHRHEPASQPRFSKLKLFEMYAIKDERKTERYTTQTAEQSSSHVGEERKSRTLQSSVLNESKDLFVKPFCKRLLRSLSFPTRHG